MAIKILIINFRLDGALIFELSDQILVTARQDMTALSLRLPPEIGRVARPRQYGGYMHRCTLAEYHS
ncbi:hypothetical protein SAMN05428978_100924 [Nitrosomonas sp. Nm34]|nr:hypothetical protein SAMN05428978_100924 [Nitrosomonas sp. Nm34]